MKKIDRQIIHLAWPAIVANITTPLLGLVDLAIVGHMDNPAAIAAIALGGSVFSMLYWVFAFLRMGTSGQTAQAEGREDTTESAAVFWRGMITAVTAGIVLIALQFFTIPRLLAFLGADAGAGALASDYCSVLIWGAPAMLGTYVLSGWFIGKQDTRPALAMSLVINLTNIAASLVFVYVCRWGVAGVAAGTLAAQWSGLAYGLIKAHALGCGLPRVRQVAQLQKMKRFFSLNFDIFIRTLCLVAVTVWFTRSGARQSDIILSVNALLMQLFILFSYFMDGFAYAGEALVGKSTGQGDRSMTTGIVKGLFKWGSCIALLFTLLYAAGGDVILRLLSDDGSIAAASADYRWWAATMPFAGFGAFLWDGIFIGATRTRQMLLSMALATAVFFGLYTLTYPTLGNHGLWLAFVSYLLTRGLMQTFLFVKK